MDIGKLAAPKGNDQNRSVERTRSRKHSSQVAALQGGGAQATSPTDSVQISGSARSLGQVVETYVGKLHDLDQSTQLDSAQVADYRSRLATGSLTTPQILEATAARLLEDL